MIAAAFLAGAIVGVEAGFLLAAILAATRAHKLTGQLEHWREMARRYVLDVQAEDQAAEEG